MPHSPRTGLLRRHALAVLTLTALGLAACTGTDVGQGRPGSPGNSPTVADDPPSGFATLVLAPADPRPPTSGEGQNGPIGTVWYRTQAAGTSSDVWFEWYVRAQRLHAGLIYRIEVTVDDRATYAIGSARSDDNGMLAAHGTLTQFADQYCVGDPSPPEPVAGAHALRVSVKRDGSGSGPAGFGGALTDPTRALPCRGNGDGVFDYWLVSHDVFHIGLAPQAAGPR
jgi:hypothetical protein